LLVREEGVRLRQRGWKACAFAKGLNVIARAETHTEVVAQADSVLGEGGVLFGVRMGGGGAEVLDVVAGHAMGVSAEGRELQAALFWNKGEGVDLMAEKMYSPRRERERSC